MSKINCDLINVSICLTDLEKNLLQKATNGKIYLNAVITNRKEPDEFGNDLTCYYSQRKNEDGTKPIKKYVKSNCKSINLSVSEKPEFIEKPVSTVDLDDLPF